MNCGRKNKKSIDQKHREEQGIKNIGKSKGALHDGQKKEDRRDQHCCFWLVNQHYII
jgi:hypothetical protein